MLAGILGAIVSGFFGSGLKTISDELGRAYERKLAAETSEAKLDAERDIAALTAKRDVLIAESGAGGIRAWIRPLFALPFVIYVWKLVEWDKVLALGATDALSPELASIMMLVIGAYFVDRTAKAIVRTWRG
jgi:hypothetical protein